jgi:hypothetical protein
VQKAISPCRRNLGVPVAFSHFLKKKISESGESAESGEWGFASRAPAEPAKNGDEADFHAAIMPQIRPGR